MPDGPLSERHRSALSTQKALNRATWQQLVALGVTGTTELELDFSYVAPSESEALALRETLARETDYTLALGHGAGATWTVGGTTQPTHVTLETLDAWVDWMITKGLSEDCEFDGWGTEAPASAASAAGTRAKRESIAVRRPARD